MLSNDNLPAGFKILSETPELRIKYLSQANGCLILFFLPFIALFLGHIWLLILVAQEILNFGLWQAIQKLPHKNWDFCLFLFSFLLLGAITVFALWFTFGITEFKASRESLVVSKKLFGMSKKNRIPTINIQYFYQIKDGGEDMDSFPSWGLEVVTNHKIHERTISFPSWIQADENTINRLIYKTIVLLSKQPIDKSDWLGRVLADFYKVEFRMTEKRR